MRCVVLMVGLVAVGMLAGTVLGGGSVVDLAIDPEQSFADFEVWLRWILRHG